VVEGGLQPIDGGEVHAVAIVLAGDGLPDGGGVVPERSGEIGALDSAGGQSGAGASFLLGSLAQSVGLSPSLPQSARALFVPLGRVWQITRAKRAC
jgi:hypothetical protein